MPEQIPTADPTAEGVDRKQLRVALQRFRKINDARLDRLRGMLGNQQRMFIDLLPLLLHSNHPTLPGYVSHNTPCGVSDYVPSSTTLKLAKQVSRSFSWQRPAVSEAGVYGVYVMGSSGSIGHSDSSDIDVWVCYPEHLDQAALQALQQKVVLLQQWAEALGLESHLFLMNDLKFRRGQREPLTGENCGTAQHHLLIDEFYRTGVLLAGRIPGWWLVPPEAGQHYEEFMAELIGKRYLGNTSPVDFGGIRHVPAGEFVGAGIWQLYKAIASPYKSVLKLLLFEVYAANFPEPACLSSDFKRSVYAGVVDIDELDPYVMNYRRLERHLLAREEPERLEIVRRCLYYKAGKKLSRPPNLGVKSWQRKLMERLVDEWGWDRAKLVMLDSRSSWGIRDVALERNELVRELNYSYRFLSEFARHSQATTMIDAGEFRVLGRRLYAAHDRRAGKIEIVNPGRAINVTENELSICAIHGPNGFSANPVWGVYRELVAPGAIPATPALQQCASLTELLAWSVINGVIGEQTRTLVREVLDGVRTQEVECMVREIRTHVLPPLEKGSLLDEAFVDPARAMLNLVFVNVAADPLRESRDKGLHRISSRTDPLGYSAMRENLVLNLEMLSCNSWGEVVATRYSGLDGLIRCLLDARQQAAPHGESPAPVLVRCFCPSRPDAIAARIDELFRTLVTGVTEDFARNGRFVLAAENALHLLQFAPGASSCRKAEDLDQLVRLLGDKQSQWSPLKLDPYALENSPLPVMVDALTPDTISVFCETTADRRLVLTVVDERGSWFRTEHRGANETSALGAVDQFLASVRYRQNTAGEQSVMPRYFRIESERGAYALRTMNPPNLYGRSKFLNIQAIVETAADAAPTYTVWCAGEAFSQRMLGKAFHRALAEHVLGLRHAAEQYSVYLTDIDLSALERASGATFQSAQYLQHKELLEREINEALAACRT